MPTLSQILVVGPSLASATTFDLSPRPHQDVPSRVSPLSPLSPRRINLCSLQLTFIHPPSRHCSLRLSGVPILVTPSASCQLEFVNFRRRTPAKWKGAAKGALGLQNWMQSLHHALPPAFPTIPGLLPSFFLFSSSIPVYRALFCQVVPQSIWFVPTQTELYEICARSFCVSLLRSL